MSHVIFVIACLDRFETLEQQLVSEREIKSVDNILESYLGSVCLLKPRRKKDKLLDKTALAEELAISTLAEVGRRNLTKKKQSFEKELDKVMTWLKSLKAN